MNDPNYPLFPSTDRYQVVKPLGSGGMGVVYEARDLERGIPVALKTYKYRDAHSLYRFKMEFRSLADLSHPNLVTLYDLVIEDGVCFYTMELVEGEDLVRYCTSVDREMGHRFDEQRLRETLTQLAQGIQALHNGGKVHRDIKPSNVLVNERGQVVLLDFGLVAATSPELTMTETMGIVGTAVYMAPEQALSESHTTQAADLYSMGVVLYQALTGELPFEGTSIEVLQKKQHLDPPLPQAINPAVPDDLNQLCGELMSRNPYSRATVTDVIQRLKQSGETQSGETVQHTATGDSPDEPERFRFIGRETELDALARQFECTVQGELALSMVRGESGIGKSALVRAFLDRIRTRHPNVVILKGRCYERENVPYKAIDGVVDNLSRYWRSFDMEAATYILPRSVDLLTRLFPVLQRVNEVAQAPTKNREIEDPRDLRSGGIAALRELLNRLSTIHRVIVFLDDMQWVDRDTVNLLSEVLRDPDPPSLHLVLASRHAGEAESPLDELLGAHGDRAELLALSPLSAEQTASLVHELTDSLQSQLVDRVIRESGGNPFFVEQLVGILAERDDPSDVPEVDGLLMSRIQRLPEEARILLEILAVIAEPMDPVLAARAARLDQRTAERMLRLLFTRRFVSQSVGFESERIEVYHDRVRQGVLNTLTDEQRRENHRALADALEGAGQEWYAGCVWHLQHCEELEKAASYALKVAEIADHQLAFGRAAQFYGLSLTLRDYPREEAAGLMTRQADALANDGRGKEAAQIYLEAAANGAPDLAISCRQKAAHCLFRSGHIDEGFAVQAPVLKARGLTFPDTRAGMMRYIIVQQALHALRWPNRGVTTREEREIAPQLLEQTDACWTAAMSMVGVDPVRTGCCAVQHARLAWKTREPSRLALAVLLNTMTAAVAGRSDKKIERGLAFVRQLLDKTSAPYAHAFYVHVLGQIASLQGRAKDAVEHFYRSNKMFRAHCTGVEQELTGAEFIIDINLFYLGELKEIHRRFVQSSAQAKRRGNLYAMTMPYCSIAAAVWLARDEVGFAREKMKEMMARWSPSSFYLQHFYAVIAEAQILLYEKRGEKARGMLSAKHKQIKASGLYRTQFGRIMMRDLEARCILSAADGATPNRRLLKRAEALAKKLSAERRPWAVGMSRLISAQVLAMQHHEERAARAYEAAREAFESRHMALHAAAARYGRGQVLGGDEGRVLTESASTFLHAQGVVKGEAFLALFLPGII